MDNKRGFTLMELLAVVAIIGILAGLISSGVEAARKKAYRAQAQVMLSTLEMAISMYKTDTDLFPLDDGGGFTTCAALVTGLSNPSLPPAGWRGPYMQFRPSELSGGSVVDPWGRSYRYNSSTPPNNTSTYDLWSEGPTENPAEDPDDIKNW